MSVCATNSVVFDARKGSLCRRKLVANERWAMLNKKTFQEILNALLAQTTTTASSSPSQHPTATASALTFTLGQRSMLNKSTCAPNGRTTTKVPRCDFSGNGWAPVDECKTASSNLESDETSGRVGCRVVSADDDDDDDVEIKDRCVREATDNLHSLPAVSTATGPFIIGLGGTGQREFILGQSNLATVGENLQGVGILIVCAMPPSADTNQYHFSSCLPESATASRNAVDRRDGCKPQTPSLQSPSLDAAAAAAAFMTGIEAVSGVASERVAQNALPRFRLGKKAEEDKLGSDEGEPLQRIDGGVLSQSHRVMSRSALPERYRSHRLLNSLHPSSSHRSFDFNKASSQICSRKLCFSAGQPDLDHLRRLNPDHTSKPQEATSESFTSDISTTVVGTETSRICNGSSSTGTRSIRGESNAEIWSTNAIINANPKHESAAYILSRGTDIAERTKSKNFITPESTHKFITLRDIPFLTGHLSTRDGGIGTKVSPSKDKTNVVLSSRTIASQGAAGLRHSEQSLSLSWSRWMAVDKDVLFCIIEHVLNAEAVAFNSGFCFKTPASSRKGFASSSERPATTAGGVERLQSHWATVFRSSQLGGIFEETGGRSCHLSPVEPLARNRPDSVLESRTTENVMNNLDDRTDALPDLKTGSKDDLTSVEISRCFAHFRVGGRAEKHRPPRGTGRRHVVTNRKRKCNHPSGLSGRAHEVSSSDREADMLTGLTDEDVERRGDDGTSGETGGGVSASFKWKSKMMMRLGVESRRRTHVAITDEENV